MMLIFLTLIAYHLSLITSTSQVRLDFGSNSPLRKLQIAESAVNSLYVDKLDEQALVEDAIRGLLKNLDPHSTYTTAKETKQMNEPLSGSFEGIGVQFNMVDDTLLVIQPTLGGPSEKAGILAGDRIVSVNDTAIAGVKMSREEIMKRLRGKKGTKVQMGVVRRGIRDRLSFTVTRDKIPVHTVDAVYMIRPGIGYIRVGSFGATTYDEFIEGVQKLKGEGMKDIIIDLQENGGGYLQTAVRIVNEFLHRDDLVVYTEGRAVPRQEFKADGNGKMVDGRVVVLINEYSASAAEILAGAIQDQDRGQIVGRRSFGKGLVQRPIEFSDGSMIRLTVAHYYTPSGRCIQKPYEKGENKEYAEDIERRFKHGELYSADSIHFADSLRFETLRLHRPVYGGGGIMPDFFVPLDTTQFTSFHRNLMAKNFVVNTNLKYMDKHGKQLRREYKTFDDFNRRYEIPQSVIDKMLAEAAEQNVKPKDDDELAKTLPRLRMQLKALVARDIWTMTEYFRITNEQNHIVQRALTVLDNQQ
ncbi:MAG: S41 family peptidase [Prevotella sp.]|nr:S41 family peptidase [Prevotella sp.]